MTAAAVGAPVVPQAAPAGDENTERHNDDPKETTDAAFSAALMSGIGVTVIDLRRCRRRRRRRRRCRRGGSVGSVIGLSTVKVKCSSEIVRREEVSTVWIQEVSDRTKAEAPSFSSRKSKTVSRNVHSFPVSQSSPGRSHRAHAGDPDLPIGYPEEQAMG